SRGAGLRHHARARHARGPGLGARGARADRGQVRPRPPRPARGGALRRADGAARVRVLHVGKFYPPVRGGMETVLASLCEGTAKRWQVRAVVANGGPRTVRERMNGVEVVRVGTLARALSVSLSPGLARELWRERFDCVVLHEPN